MNFSEFIAILMSFSSNSEKIALKLKFFIIWHLITSNFESRLWVSAVYRNISGPQTQDLSDIVNWCQFQWILCLIRDLIFYHWYHENKD